MPKSVMMERMWLVVDTQNERTTRRRIYSVKRLGIQVYNGQHGRNKKREYKSSSTR